LGGNALRGNLGKSLFTGESVSHLIATHIGVTAALAFASLALGLALAIPLAFLPQRGQQLARPRELTFAASGYAIPSFWFGLILIYIFGVRLRWLPTSGSDGWTHFVLPTIALGIADDARDHAAHARRHARRALGDYVRTARAKGLRTMTVLYRHALPNAILPVVSIPLRSWGCCSAAR